MSTRSTISVERTDGTVVSAYCHHDGYVDGVGFTLRDHYDTYEKALALVLGGGMSSVGELCDGATGHSYDTPTDGQTVYYHRDRGEPALQLAEYPDVAAWEAGTGQAYDYLFSGGTWLVSRRGNKTERVTVTEYAEKEGA